MEAEAYSVSSAAEECCACASWRFAKNCECLSELRRHRFCDGHRRDMLVAIGKMEYQTVTQADRRRLADAADLN